MLEKQIDKLEESLPPIKYFIHPGGSLEAAHLHYARTLARRVERRYISYSNEKDQLKFFNRLSDYLFVAARYMNHVNKVEDLGVK